MEEELRNQGKGGCDGQEQEEQQHWTSDTGVAVAGRLIVLDSVSGCLSTAVMDHELGLVRDVAWCLQRLARNYPVAVLLTNSVTSGGTPSLGKQWSHVADISSHVECEGERQCDSRHTASASRQAVSYGTKGICGFCSDDKRCRRSTNYVVSTVCVPIKGTTSFCFTIRSKTVGIGTIGNSTLLPLPP